MIDTHGAQQILVVQNDVDKSLGRISDGIALTAAELDVRMATAALPRVADYAGLIVLPGMADPIDDDPAVHNARAAIEQALNCGIPVLGLCLGGQLLNQLLGGEIYRCNNEVGYHDVCSTPAAQDDPLLMGVPERYLSFHAHAFAFRPPAGATVLLENAVSVQAMRLGEAWAFQCHPEISLAWADALAQGLRGTAIGILPESVAFFQRNGVDPDTLSRDARTANATAQQLANGIARGFVERCRAAAAK